MAGALGVRVAPFKWFLIYFLSCALTWALPLKFVYYLSWASALICTYAASCCLSIYRIYSCINSIWSNFGIFLIFSVVLPFGRTRSTLWLYGCIKGIGFLVGGINIFLGLKCSSGWIKLPSLSLLMVFFYFPFPLVFKFRLVSWSSSSWIYLSILLFK